MTAAGRVWSRVLPRPRKPVPRAAWALPIGFVVVWIATIITLEVADVVSFTRRWPLVLVVPLVPWCWWLAVAGAQRLGPVRRVAAVLVRLVILGLAMAALAEPRAVRTETDQTTIYVVDHSASVAEDATDGALEFVLRTAAQKPQRDDVGLLFFGRNAAVELPPAQTLPFEAINVDVDRDGTDLAKALSLAAALLPGEQRGRIVVVGDGAATEGDLQATIKDLVARDVPVDVLPIDYGWNNEVWLERLELPREIRLGEDFAAGVVMSSLREGRGTLLLEENGQRIFEQQVEFGAGKSRFDVPLLLRNAGYYEYTARLEVDGGSDSWTRNNVAISYVFLEGRGRALLVFDPAGDPRDWRPFAETLRAGDRTVDAVAAHQVPRQTEALLPYDCVLLVNVPREEFDSAQLVALHDAVKEQGLGLVMVGGPDSFGPGGYHRTPVEAALPVLMEMPQRKVLPKGALAIVLHTCEFAQGNTWGKRITKQAMQVLSPQDEVGVLVFDGTARWLFPLTPAEKYEELATKVNSARIGDMPSFVDTMEVGLTGLMSSDASTRHMIIISDGDPSPPPPPLLQKFVRNKISVSTVTVFPHGNNDTSVMRQIARLTGGRYYEPNDAAKLPKIFIKEAKTLRRSAIVNKTFAPELSAASPIAKGVFEAGMPLLHGLVLTTEKPRATVVLREPQDEEGNWPAPVLAHWRYGTGAAAAFTSDFSPSWGRDWLAWEEFDEFVKQLLTEIARSREPSDLHVRSFATGGGGGGAGRGIVWVEDHASEARFLDLTVAVRRPGIGTERVVRVELEQVGPGRYRGEFPLSGRGRYQVRAVGVDEAGESMNAHGGFVVPYSREYLRFRSDPIALNRIAEETGGRVLTGGESGPDLFGADRRPKISTTSVVDVLLLILCCLLPFDVGVRRLQLDVAALWRRRAAGESESATLGSLLAQRRAAIATAKPSVPAAPPPNRDAPLPPSSGSPARTTTARTGRGADRSAPAAAGGGGGVGGSTMQRLLAAKRRTAAGGDAGATERPEREDEERDDG